MSDPTEKLAALSAKAEVKADYLLTRLVAFPYSWVPAVVILGLAVKGAYSLL